jgi:hypothetical protein
LNGMHGMNDIAGLFWSGTGYSLAQYLDDDSLILYEFRPSPALDGNPRRKLRKRLEGLEDAADVFTESIYAIGLYTGARMTLYREAGGLKMFPEIGDARFRNRLEYLAALDGNGPVTVNPATGAYFQDLGGSGFVRGSLYAEGTRILFPLHEGP